MMIHFFLRAKNRSGHGSPAGMSFRKSDIIFLDRVIHAPHRINGLKQAANIPMSLYFFTMKPENCIKTAE